MKKEDLIIVGIGASAGGLEALQGFVRNLPKDENIAYILAQHLSPTYKSMMVELLAKDSTIKILEASNNEEIKPNTMYICPPNKNIIVDEENKLLIVDPKQLTYGPKPSINILFESIANVKGSKSIGIILSGTGSDGSRGIRAIKAEGGFTIVQQPQNAKYDGMPNSAINTGNIDLILDVEVMGHEIIELLKYPNKTESLNNLTEKTITYRNILSKLNTVKDVDFSLYKVSTIQRRIERRMAALKLTKINDYYDFLLKNIGEIDSLFNDILIGVTSFFRDEDAFEALRDNLKELIAKKSSKKSIRIWIPGCSTGEEVYTIAMILNEILGAEIANYKVQIFATDIDEESLKFARIGRYPESSLVDVNRSYIKKYFAIKNEEYEVIKPVRDICIFSRHDIIKDPAFLKLDLISCRNLLIYFSAELQNKIFPIFHYSLNEESLLFLGKSESIGNFNHQFTMIDKRAKIFKTIFVGQKRAPSPVRSLKSVYQYSKDIAQVTNTPTISDMMLEYIQRHIIPNCLVVNDGFDIVFIKGSNQYLIRPEGEITQNVFKNVLPDLSIELRSALHQSKNDGSLVKSQFKKVTVNNESKYVRFLITPLDNPLTNNLFLICFQEEDHNNLLNYEFDVNLKSEDKEIEQLQIELTKVREHLQTVIEELETSNEEMQSLNEELQSSNEELQSSNEELETTNEELQSTNEELQTAYAEISAMYDERNKVATQAEELKNENDDTSYRLNAIVDLEEIGLLDLDLIKNNIIYVNEQFAKILGFNILELKEIGESFDVWLQRRIHPDDLADEKQRYEDILLAKKEKYSVKLRVLNRKNEYITVKKSVISKIQNNRALRALVLLSEI